MIVSHKHRFIFIKTAKTAGTSIEIALSKYCGPDDIISPVSRKDEKMRRRLGYPSAQNYKKSAGDFTLSDWIQRIKRRRPLPLFRNHMSAAEMRSLLPEEVWQNYYKFCFERNPYDKVVSFYFWIGRKYKDIHEFVRSDEAGTVRGAELYTINSEVVVDRIYKYEEMESALADITNRFQLDPPLRLDGIRAKGGHRKDRRHFSEILSPEDMEIIENLYPAEFRIMGYQKQGQPL